MNKFLNRMFFDMRLFAGNRSFPSNCFNMGKNMIAALVADCDAATRTETGIALENMGCRVAFAFDGCDVIGALQISRCDLLVVSLVLARWDGYTVLGKIPSLNLSRYPYVVAQTAMGDAECDRALAMGADAAFRKPVTRQNWKDTLPLVQSEIPRAANTVAEKRFPAAQRCVASLGIPTHLKGFHYLSRAVTLCSVDDRLMDNATSMLYPWLARTYMTTTGGVEHAIRQAIETTWTRGSMENLLTLFGNSIDPQRGKPTNIECIARLAEIIRRSER